MTQEKHTLGQAIDRLIDALDPLDSSMRTTALLAVCAHLQIDLGSMGKMASGSGGFGAATPSAAVQAAAPATALSSAPALASKPVRMDIRTLKDQKKPASAKQMACLVAYYLQEQAPEAEQKETISTTDLEKYFKQAGFKLPAHIDQVLRDAKTSGYFESAARGEYKLNAVGYNLVVHSLPSKVTEG